MMRGIQRWLAKAVLASLAGFGLAACSDEPEELITKAQTALQDGDTDGALTAARSAKTALLEQESPDPSLLGWARYYEFKALYTAKKYDEARALLDKNETKPHLVTATNAAWMSSVGAELAARAGDADGTVKQADSCIAHRKEANDVRSEAVCSVTACTLFGKDYLKRDDLKAKFGEKGVDAALKANDAGVLADALECWLDGAGAKPTPAIKASLAKKEGDIKKQLPTDGRGKDLAAKLTMLAKEDKKEKEEGDEKTAEGKDKGKDGKEKDAKGKDAKGKDAKAAKGKDVKGKDAKAAKGKAAKGKAVAGKGKGAKVKTKGAAKGKGAKGKAAKPKGKK